MCSPGDVSNYSNAGGSKVAKRIEVPKRDGTKDVYESTLFTGYHAHETDSSVCISEKTIFGEKVVQCYVKDNIGNVHVNTCSLCEELNPTQRSDIRLPGENQK
jgi:hypothetical protein